MKKIHYIIIVATLVMASCSEPIDFKPGQVEPYAVLLSRPTNDSTVCVHLAFSRFFLDNRDPEAISDATVTLDVNGVTSVGTYDAGAYLGYGGYTFTAMPQPGDTLKVTASIPGYDKTVKATTSIPHFPEVEVLDYVIDTGSGRTYDEYGYYIGDNYYYKIRFKVKSRSNDEFYSVAVEHADIRSVDTILVWDTTNWLTTSFSMNDPLVNNQNIEDVIEGYNGSFYGDEVFFSSELFQSGEHEFTMVIAYWPDYYGGYVNLDYSELPLRLRVRSLTRELYRYEQTADNASYDLFEGLFSEPVQVICNIDGGIGIFGGSSCKRFSLPTPRFETFPHDSDYYFKK